ncbi:MAG: ribosome silencing factor [Alphaproteobacteria bacterium]|nr:ribosome silencing factor [Alphaproteobacteria bacterium]
MKLKEKPSPQIATKILAIVEKSLDDDQANDVTVISLMGKTDIAEYMVIASGRSARHVDSTTDHLISKLKKAGITGIRSEGRHLKDWVLIDAGYVIINLFRPEVRSHYDLEKLWETEIHEKNLTESLKN